MERKDAERAEARRLRAEGLSVKTIARTVGVSPSSVSVWVRDVELPPPPPPDPPPAPVDDGTRRRCPRCATDLPLSAFNRAGDGHQHWCRECFRTYFRERGATHREQSGAARERRRGAAREFLRGYLATHPCVDCGEDDIFVLEFDHHLGEKEANVSRLLADRARLSRIRTEVERCEVVCVNCHRRRTATRAQQFRVTGRFPAVWTAGQRRDAAYVVEVLRAAGCADCGERDPVVLEFDHIGEKRAMVTRLAAFGASIATLQAEIRQCLVRCANCHRLRTLAQAECWREGDHWAVALHHGG